MIDSLLRFDFSPKMFRTKSNHVQWILSASRDRKIILWKLIDGKIMSKCDYPPVKIQDKPAKITRQKKQKNNRANNNSSQNRNNQSSNFKKNKLSSAAESTSQKVKEK